jgi:hypothetical protein
MKRRNFVKQSIAGAIIAATPLALTGLVRAEGGGGSGSTSTDTTDWWDTTGTTEESSTTTDQTTTEIETTAPPALECSYMSFIDQVIENGVSTLKKWKWKDANGVWSCLYRGTCVDSNGQTISVYQDLGSCNNLPCPSASEIPKDGNGDYSSDYLNTLCVMS